MFRWLIFEIKQMMFNRKNLIIFAVLLISHLLIVSVFENDDGIRSKQLSMPGFGYELVDDELNKAIAENNVEKYNEIKLIRQLKEVNRVERYLLNMEVPTESSLKAKVDSYYNNFDLHQQLKQEIYEKYGFIDDNIDVEVSVSVYNSRVSHLQYNLEVLNKGFMLYDAPSRSSLTITVTLYRIYLVFIVLLAPLIVGFDNISKDKKDGSIKTIMALSQSRSRYYVVKLFSTLIVSMMMIFLPFIIAMLVNNVSIINDLSHPAFVYSDGLTSFKTISPFSAAQHPAYILDVFSIVSRTSYNINEFGVSVGLHTGVRLLSLGHLLAYSMILIALLVLFVLTVQLSLTINVNKYVALMITMLILTILFYLTLQKNLVVTPINDRNYFVHQPNLFEVINPLAYMRTLDVVEGTVPFTFFGGITVLSSFSLIVSLVSNWFLKSKDITD